jgi:hypothetical protein
MATMLIPFNVTTPPFNLRHKTKINRVYDGCPVNWLQKISNQKMPSLPKFLTAQKDLFLG